MPETSPPSVSVVIPCHNAGRWVSRAISSALEQTRPAGEVIVVDDASSDDSASEIKAFGDRMRFLQGAWRNGNAARNAGLAAAGGEWVQFLDADDRLEPAKIARQLAEAGDLPSADVLYSPVLVETWRDGQAAGRAPTRIDPAADLFTQWLGWQLPQTGGALWRREALLRIGGWKDGQPCCQEHELYLRALKAGLRFRFCPTPGAIYRIWSEDTVCRRDPARLIREKTRLIDDLLKWLAAKNALAREHRALAGRVCFEMSRTWATLDLAAARDYFRERRRLGLINPEGPAAPPAYRVALKTLGFPLAESLAAKLRKSP